MNKTTGKSSLFDRLPGSLIKKADVTLFPEAALGYLTGPMLALLANAVLANYFNKYMSDVLHVNTWASAFFTWLPAISVIFIIMGNILVGRLMDHNGSLHGRARPLLLMSVPISLVALLFLFVLSPYEAAGTGWHSGALVCLAIGYNLWFALAYPMYYTPHAALVSLSTRNAKDRSLLATISNGTPLAAVGVASMVLPFFLSLLFVYDMSGIGTPVTNAAGIVQYYVDETGSAIYDAQASYNHWKLFVLFLIVITLAGVLLEYFFTRERVTEETASRSDAGKAALSVREQAGICLKDRYWIIMMLFFFLFQFGGMLKNVSQNYFCTVMFRDASGNYTVAFGGQMQGILSIIGGIPTALGMLVSLPLANRIGKAKAVRLGALIAVAGGLLGFLAPASFSMVAVSFFIKALGSAPAMYLSLALLADIIDHQEAIYGIRTDGLSMTIYGAIMAGMTGLSTGVLNAVLSAFHYDVATLQTNDAIRSAMPWVFIGVETLCYLLIFLIFIGMKVEKYGELDRRAILFDQNRAHVTDNSSQVSRQMAAPEQSDRKLPADEVLLTEFNQLRAANGRPVVPF